MNKKYKIILISAILLIFQFHGSLVSASSLTDNLTRQEFTNSLYQIINTDLPEMDEIIPDYRSTNLYLNSLFITNFYTSNKSKSSDAKALSYALGEVLRYEVSSEATKQLYMSGYHLYYRDSEYLFKHSKDKKDFLKRTKKLAKIWSINNIATGNFQLTNNKYSWTIELINLKQNKITASRQWQGKLNDLPNALIEAKYFILSKLLNDSKQFKNNKLIFDIKNYDTLKTYGEFIIQKSTRDKDSLLEYATNIWESGLKLPAIGVAIIQSLHYTKKNSSYYEKIMYQTVSHFKHPHIKALHALLHGIDGDYADRDEHITTLKNLILDYPDDPTLMISLANLLSETAHELPALTISTEAIIRWPGLHRAWAATSQSIFRYSWVIRGTEYWRNVPKNSKREFRQLQQLSSKAADNCSSIITRHPLCSISKMLTQRGYTYELRKLFKYSTELEPHNNRPYDIALNFFSKKWGGSDQAQKRVLELAIKNNPNSEWVEELRKRWAPNISTSSSSLYIWIVVLLGIGLLIAFLIYRRNTNNC